MTEVINSIGILTEPHLKRWEVEALRMISEWEEVSICKVFVNKSNMRLSEDTAKANNKLMSFPKLKLGLRSFANYRWWALVLLEREVSRFFGSEYPNRKRINIRDVDFLSEKSIHTVEPITDGIWSEFPNETVGLVKKNCDILVRFGFGLVRGNILSAAEHGLLSYHPADIRKYRGLGPEIVYIEGENIITPTLQRLKEDIDAGEIIHQDHIDISDCNTLWEVYESVYSGQIPMLKTGIEKLNSPGFSPDNPNTLGEYNSMSSKNTFENSIKILSKNMCGRAKKLSGWFEGEK